MHEDDDLEIDLEPGKEPEYDLEVAEILAEVRGVEYRLLNFGDPNSKEYKETLAEIEAIKAALKARGFQIDHLN
jgi:hypothetical protein